VAIGSCTGGVNCYDGHNGYDLNLRFESVLSVAAGTVIRAGWYDPMNHQSALGLWAAVDHGNGYVTAYGHLSALTVYNGERVGTQWQLGTSGTTGSSTGPHLHMATYYLPNWSATDPFGWTGNYPDPNVVPDNYLWVSNPGTSYSVPDLSGNGSAIYPGATMVDDGSSGWSSTGGWATATGSTDINGNLHYTGTSSGSTTATATWQPHLPGDGYYEVGVFVNDNHASSSWASYIVYSADPNNPNTVQSHTVYVDESHIGSFQGPYGWETTGPQWVSLGTFYFRAAQGDHVVLSNATGENGLQISADGMEFALVTGLTPTPLPTYSFTVPIDGTPRSMLLGGTVAVNVTFQNTSNFTWNASGSSMVQGIYRWVNAQNQVVLTGRPVNLPRDVAVNASATLPVSVQTPTQTGTYSLQWDLVQGSTVFSQHGAHTQNDSVMVTRYSTVISYNHLTTNLPRTYYFAEGYTGTGTTEYLSLTNPTTNTATITVTYLFAQGSPLTRSYQMSAQAHTVLTINQEVGANQTVGMIVQGNQPFVAERSMYTQKGRFVAASDSVGSPVLSTHWYFAQGNTTPGWNTLLAVLNPLPQPVTINVTYLLDSHGISRSVHSTHVIPALARGTIVLNGIVPNQQFGMVITASSAVLIERPEYLVVGSRHGGNSVVGATAPQTTWYFAGGNTSAGFSENLVLANPSPNAATVQIRYLGASGQVVSQRVSIPGMSRSTVNVNNVFRQGIHATVITSNVPIVAERQDFFSTSFNGNVLGSTTLLGSSHAYNNWFVARGDTTSGHAEYLALANPNATAVQVQVVYYLASGTPVVTMHTIAANARLSISLLSDLGPNRMAGMAIYAVYCATQDSLTRRIYRTRKHARWPFSLSGKWFWANAFL